MKLLGMELRRAPQVAKKSADELWVTKDGRRMTIGEMTESHAKHSLALIMRNVRAGKRLGLDKEGRMCWRPPLVDSDALAEWILELYELRSDEMLQELVDPLGQDSFHYGKPGDPGIYFPLLPFGGRR